MGRKSKFRDDMRRIVGFTGYKSDEVEQEPKTPIGAGRGIAWYNSSGDVSSAGGAKGSNAPTLPNGVQDELENEAGGSSSSGRTDDSEQIGQKPAAEPTTVGDYDTIGLTNGAVNQITGLFDCITGTPVVLNFSSGDPFYPIPEGWDEAECYIVSAVDGQCCPTVSDWVEDRVYFNYYFRYCTADGVAAGYESIRAVDWFLAPSLVTAPFGAPTGAGLASGGGTLVKNTDPFSPAFCTGSQGWTKINPKTCGIPLNNQGGTIAWNQDEQDAFEAICATQPPYDCEWPVDNVIHYSINPDGSITTSSFDTDAPPSSNAGAGSLTVCDAQDRKVQILPAVNGGYVIRKLDSNGDSIGINYYRDPSTGRLSFFDNTQLSANVASYWPFPE